MPYQLCEVARETQFAPESVEVQMFPPSTVAASLVPSLEEVMPYQAFEVRPAVRRPICSRIVGGPDVSGVFNRGEFGAIARGGDPMPILSRSKRHSWARSQSTSETRSKTNGIFLTRCVGRRGQTHTRGCCLETPVSLHTARPGRPRCLFLHKSPASRAVGLMRRIARRLICLASASPARKRVSLGPNRGVRTDVRPAIDSALVATITSGARRDGGESEDLFALVR